MINGMWRCACKAKMNSANVTQCRKCKQRKSIIKLTESGHIEVHRKTGPFSESTIKFIDDEPPNEKEK